VDLLEGAQNTMIPKVGLEHPATARTLHWLACGYEKQGKLPESVELRQKVVELSRKVFGEDHRFTMTDVIELQSLQKRLQTGILGNEFFR